MKLSMEMDTLIAPGFVGKIGMETESASILNHMDFGLPNLSMPIEPAQMELCLEKPQQRRPWMIHDHLRCPVVGTCLTLDEQKKILKKVSNFRLRTCKGKLKKFYKIKKLSDTPPAKRVASGSPP